MKNIAKIFTGRVYHARHLPFFHDYTLRVFTFVCDWDLLNALHKQSRFFSLNRWNLFSLNWGDHGLRDGSDPALWIREEAKKAGLDIEGGSIVFQGFPRVLGYVFNPLSLFYLYDRDGQLQAVMHQVKNTFGGQHCYLLRVSQGHDETRIKQQVDKVFHVSPFMDMDCRYHFTLTPPDETGFMSVIHQSAEAENNATILTATWSGEQAYEWNDKNLSTLFFKIPFMSFKVILAIHWQALRLFLKGAKYRSGPTHPPEKITRA